MPAQRRQDNDFALTTFTSSSASGSNSNMVNGGVEPAWELENDSPSFHDRDDTAEESDALLGRGGVRGVDETYNAQRLVGHEMASESDTPGPTIWKSLILESVTEAKLQDNTLTNNR